MNSEKLPGPDRIPPGEVKAAANAEPDIVLTICKNTKDEILRRTAPREFVLGTTPCCPPMTPTPHRVQPLPAIDLQSGLEACYQQSVTIY